MFLHAKLYVISYLGDPDEGGCLHLSFYLTLV